MHLIAVDTACQLRNDRRDRLHGRRLPPPPAAPPPPVDHLPDPAGRGVSRGAEAACARQRDRSTARASASTRPTSVAVRAGHRDRQPGRQVRQVRDAAPGAASAAASTSTTGRRIASRRVRRRRRRSPERQRASTAGSIVTSSASTSSAARACLQKAPAKVPSSGQVHVGDHLVALGDQAEQAVVGRRSGRRTDRGHVRLVARALDRRPHLAGLDLDVDHGAVAGVRLGPGEAAGVGQLGGQGAQHRRRQPTRRVRSEDLPGPHG